MSRTTWLVIGADAALRERLAALAPEGIAVVHAAAEPAARAPLGADALLYGAATPGQLAALTQRGALARWAHDHAVVVLAGTADAELEDELIALGVEAIAGPPEAADAAALARARRHAVQRKRLERATRNAFATDLSTGLPHAAQLLEHLTQMLALREREPAPLVLLVLRVQGYAAAATALGDDAADVLRRKVAVRLRAVLRASDVVASIGPDLFAALLGHVDAAGDGARVAAKLVHALAEPFAVGGAACGVTASVGLAACPEHGKDAETLLRRALAQAGSVATLPGETGDSGDDPSGFGAPTAAMGLMPRDGGAANDDGDESR